MIICTFPQITELKAKNFEAENAMRNKIKDNDRLYEMKIDVLNKKIANLVKDAATLSRSAKRGGGGGGGGAANANAGNGNSNASSAVIKDSGGSGTDSPVTN